MKRCGYRTPTFDASRSYQAQAVGKINGSYQMIAKSRQE
jgi:hypothetical protein